MTALPALGDGSHRLDCAALPLPSLHPLRQGRLAVDLVVAAGVVRRCAFDPAAGHRGDERLLEVRDFRQGLALVCRHAWLTAPFAETAYARALEQGLGMQVPPRAAALRELSMALNAVAVEALWQYLETSDAAQLDRREAALTALERLTGARMHTTYVRIGGVAADATEADLAAFTECIDASDSGRALAQAISRVTDTTGAIQQQLPKTLRLPRGEYFTRLHTPHGPLSIWVVGTGDKVPHRVRIVHDSQRRLQALESECIGRPVGEFLERLATLRLVPTEVSR